ncbi:zinc-binding dehydrogenase [Ottowia thiooxydans]|uniref:zinc-binding dehydrogenase n=1 Tax=Ottowia thiooxydans TaxID=219182 RepID=UPI0003FCDEB1|nr:zinc-binding dehydrogenase [Ottowia thiooxydans]
MNTLPTTALELRSLVQADGTLQLSLESVPVPTPGADQVLIQMQAAPINPSDIGLLLGPADLSTVEVTGSPDRPVATARIPEPAMLRLAPRIGESMPVGNEGAGLVVAAGSSPAAQALLGRTVAAIGGAMYSQYRLMPAAQCLPLPADTTAAEGASCFVNPLTSLGMVETMKREGHTALVHTAAASNLGQMLNKVCQKDGIGLVNIVRRPEQAQLLRDLGAKYVCDSSAPGFLEDLTNALADTGATIAFDATGGPLAGQILQCMETAISRNAKEYSRYGSAVHKQVYLYGQLDPRPVEIHRNFGMAWSVGGWLLFPFLHKIGNEAAQVLRARVASELKTTFASHYARTVSLAGALSAENIAFYGARNTGAKVLIDPSI